MSRSEVERILSNEFSQSSLSPLLDDYESMLRNLFLRKYDLVLISGGRLVENLFICLSSLTESPVDISPDLTKIQKDLEKKPKEEFPSSIRVIIPRAAKLVYDFRSRRGAVHVDYTVSPGYIDATIVVSIVQWILAELIRVFSNRESDEILSLIQGLVDRKLPIVEEITGIPVILERDVSARDSILILLYNQYPDSISSDVLVEYLCEFTRPNILTSLRNAEKDKLAFRNGNDNYLTSNGVAYIEEKFGDRYFGGKKLER